MPSEEVCAVVVTYHPDAEVLENLAATRAQVHEMVVVDNGSTADEISMLEQASAHIGFTLQRNSDNQGIAKALNSGVRWARDRGFGWVMLFDQDSTVTDGYVTAMRRCFAEPANSRALAILVPRYVDRRFGAVLAAPVSGAGHLEAATTSGSLMTMDIFGIAGFFAEELFIDGVDYEYSLRVRRLGFTIDECVDAVLLHSPGTPSFHRSLSAKKFQTANYSPLRRYYQERNKIWVAKRYWRTFPGFCAKQFAISAKDLVKILLVEADKFRKFRFFLRGIRDGLRGRTGKLLEG